MSNELRLPITFTADHTQDHALHEFDSAITMKRKYTERTVS
jgi:hypothetical protein